MSSFFDYDIHSEDVWQKRLHDLSSRPFAREELADYLSSYHEKFHSAAMQASIEKLRDPKSAAGCRRPAGRSFNGASLHHT